MASKAGQCKCMLTENLLPALEAVRSNMSLYCFNGLQRLHEFRLLFDSFRSFCDSLESPVAKLWLSYTEMVGILLDYIRSTRTGDWKLHLLII